MSLTPGTRLGPYEVTALIGIGGMGEVYRARDTKLGRDVALKVLPDLFADDPERLARFQREARVLASLNHPNIASIYGLEESGPSTGSGQAVRALVLELVEGPTLAERIAQGAIPIDEALPIAKQIADALEAAHEAGVIHRDLKPANVKVKADGMVKVLDFGLAKALQGDVSGDPSQSPTLTAAATRMGVIMGTAAYMSPEQAKGKTADRRADIWAFGAVLYEMLAGKRAFAGGDVSDTLAFVLTKEVAWTALPTNVPGSLRHLLQRCLERDPRQRLRDIGEARIALDEKLTAPVRATAEAVAVPRLKVWQRPVPVALAVLAALGLGGLAVWSLTRPGVQPVVRFPIPLAADETFSFTGRHIVAISPTGTHIVYTANQGLSLRPLDQLRATPVSGTEAEARSPFFSPDGQSIGFWAAGQLKKVSVSGGAPVTLGDADNPWGASWGADDMILYGQGPQGIWQVPGTGGTPAQVIPVEDGEQAHGPQMLPGGEWVLFTFRPSGVSSWDQAQIVVQSLETGDRTVLIEGGRDARYVPTGHLVYALNGVLLAVPFDLAALAVVGGPVPLVDGVRDAGVAVGTGATHFSFSENGSLVYVPGVAAATTRSALVLVERGGRDTPLAEITGQYVYPRFSPDGQRVAVAIAAVPENSADADVWVLEVERGARTRLTFGGNNRFFPTWTPDGLRVAFGSIEGDLYWAPADGSGEREGLLVREGLQFVTSWAPDGGALAFYENNPDTARDLWVLSLDGEPTPSPFHVTPFEERAPTFSPDGRWLVYVSDESGQDEVYVRPYPGPGGEVIVSTGGGKEPVWARDGKDLFYRNGEQMLVVQVGAEPTFSVGTPEPLFESGYDVDISAGGIGGNPNYDISPDGQRFVMVRTTVESGRESPTLNIVLNWFEELKARVPVN